MCVAVYIPDNVERPTLEMLEKMERGNRDGAGVGWFDQQLGKCRWVKGLDHKDVYKLINELDVANRLLVHFRLASIGGKDKGLTHPFPIGMPPVMSDGNYDWMWDVRLEGQADELLIHNGHWSDWDKTVTRRRPQGPWSDSRWAAYLADCNPVILQALEGGSGKVAILNRNRVHLLGKWENLNGVWYSNTYWQNSVVYSGSSSYSGSTGYKPPGEVGPNERSADADSWNAYSRSKATETASSKSTPTNKATTDFADVRARREAAKAVRDKEKADKAKNKQQKKKGTRPLFVVDPPDGSCTDSSLSCRVAKGGSAATGPYVVEYAGPSGFMSVFCKTQEDSAVWMNYTNEEWEQFTALCVEELHKKPDDTSCYSPEMAEVQKALGRKD